MLLILGIKNCNTMKKAFTWLDENCIPYDFRDVKKDPLSKEELKSLADRVGTDTLPNRRGMKWRSLGLSDRDLSENELFGLLLEHQTMIKRPVILLNDAVMVGFDESSLDVFIKEHTDGEAG